MGRILTLLIVAALAYFLYTQGLPWLETGLRSRPEETAPEEQGAAEGACLAAARQARDLLGSEVRRFARPPIDEEMWSVSFQQIAAEIGGAETACGPCLSAACGRASEAVAELRSLALRIDEMLRGDLGGLSNPASGLERVDALLEDARAFAGGS